MKNKFFVNTANAGKGLLSVVIDGPSKVQMTCEERPDGYEFSYVPTLPGDYKISIKYGGNFDIYGSPFIVGLNPSSIYILSLVLFVTLCFVLGSHFWFPNGRYGAKGLRTIHDCA